MPEPVQRALAMQGPVMVGVPVDGLDNHRLMENVHDLTVPTWRLIS